MRKITLLALAVFTGFLGLAQMETPAPSPTATVDQMVGLTQVTIKYSRPSMRGRTIFGNLVPFGKLWRTGANANTTIFFEDDVVLGDQTLKAGTYAIFTKPGQASWEVYFYRDTQNWGTPQNWEQSKIAATVTAPVSKLNTKIETFTMTIDNITNNGATLGIWWENTYVPVTFQVPTKKMAMESIKRVMAGPSANDYYSAASYYFQEGLDLNTAKTWIDKAVDQNPEAFWMSRLQSLIYAKLGDSRGAIAAAEKSLAAARKAGNADYIKMNEESLKEWGAM